MNSFTQNIISIYETDLGNGWQESVISTEFGINKLYGQNDLLYGVNHSGDQYSYNDISKIWEPTSVVLPVAERYFSVDDILGYINPDNKLKFCDSEGQILEYEFDVFDGYLDINYYYGFTLVDSNHKVYGLDQVWSQAQKDFPATISNFFIFNDLVYFADNEYIYLFDGDNWEDVLGLPDSSNLKYFIEYQSKLIMITFSNSGEEL